MIKVKNKSKKGQKMKETEGDPYTTSKNFFKSINCKSTICKKRLYK